MVGYSWLFFSKILHAPGVAGFQPSTAVRSLYNQTKRLFDECHPLKSNPTPTLYISKHWETNGRFVKELA